MVPTFSLAKGRELDSVLDVEILESAESFLRCRHTFGQGSLARSSDKSITEADRGVGGGGKSSVRAGETGRSESTMGGGGRSPITNRDASPLTQVAKASSFMASILLSLLIEYSLSFFIELVLLGGGGGGFLLDLRVPYNCDEFILDQVC